MAEKLNPCYELLKTEVPFNITSELKETFDSVNKALHDACQLALKQPTSRKQLVLMRDASFGSAGYVFMIEDNPDQKLRSKRKLSLLSLLDHKSFPPHNSRCQFAQNNFWKSTWHFLRLHTLCGKHQNRPLS